jgi:putative tryptophan/tyrosine transport system substrate-binding protein
VKRRDFITVIVSSVVSVPIVRAQHAERVGRIGILFGGFSETDPEPMARLAMFKHRLEQLGWTDNRNIRIEVRIGAGDANRLSEYAEELIRMMPDVIVANSTPPVSALVGRTKIIPIVFANVFDPVGAGFVASLARPGGNITGFSNFEPAMSGKWLELLKEIGPNVTRVMVMFDSISPSDAEFAKAAEKLAPSFGLQFAAASVSNAADIQEAIEGIAREQNYGLVVVGGAIISANREGIVGLTAQHRIPAIYSFRYFAASGGLMSYGADARDVFSRTATYVDRILRGTNPADLPVQVPTKFELVINLKAAKALGTAVPPALLARADEVIE